MNKLLSSFRSSPCLLTSTLHQSTLTCNNGVSSFYRSYCDSNQVVNNKPLSGYKVLDLSRVLAGPWCTQILGDLGAQVFKIENPASGDDTRAWGPPFYKDPNDNIGTSYFACTNRNKKSIAVDITKKEGQDLLHQLAKECDILLENYKVGSLRKYNLDYNSMKAVNPKLVYCSITGFGQTGPYKDLPGYDFSIQAMGGLMSITGPEDTPYKAGVAIVDIMTGLYANVAIQSALHMRNRTGLGQHVDISLLEVQATFLANVASSYLLTGKIPKRIGNSHPSISPYDSLKTQDGFLVVAVGNDSQFKSLCKTLEVDASVYDTANELYSTNKNRVTNRKQLLDILNEKTLKKTTQEWVSLLGNANVPCSPINTLDKVYSHPQILERGLLWDIPLNNNNNTNTNINQNNNNNNQNNTYNIDTLKVVGSPMHFSACDLQDDKIPPPTLGQHTTEICKSIGLTNEQIEQLKQHGVLK